MEGGGRTQRKACDLCYHKKLKCDAQKPRCSTCVIYDCDCTHNAVSRKKQKPGSAMRRGEAAAKTIKTLEEELAEARRQIEKLQMGSERKFSDWYGCVGRAVEKRPAGSEVRRKSPSPLPPYEDTMALLEEYLSAFNNVFPLFEATKVFQITKAVYDNPKPDHDPVSWALLNTVLALATHTATSARTSKHRHQTSTYLSNAQSVLSQIISSDDITLLNVQIPLGLALLFWLVMDLQPAMILIATALRLAHRLGLHSKTASSHLSRRDVQQRNNVFWISYVLDRDTSMLMRVPPIQQDADIDIDIPPLLEVEAEEQAFTGFVFSSTSTSCVITPPSTSMNFFRSRILLARIQGKVYEYVYSLAAQHAHTTQRAQKIALVLQALDEWSLNIPEAFRPAALTNDRGGNGSHERMFCILYGTALGCRALISLASTADSYHYSKWLLDVREYGKNISTNDGEVFRPQEGQTPPVSKEWQTLVQTSREYMSLFENAALGIGWLESLGSCAYFTGLVCLSANAIFDTTRDLLASDQHSMDQASSLLEIMSGQESANQEKMCELRDAIREMRAYATAISSSRCSQMASCSDTTSWSDDLDAWLNPEDLAIFQSAANGWPFVT